MVRDILQLGNPLLYEKSALVLPEEIPGLRDTIADLHDTLFAFRRQYGCGRAIAAPQIGVLKRLIYMHTGTPTVFINPVLHFPTDARMEVLDDCMSFPHLLVRVKRHRECRVDFLNETGTPQTLAFRGDLAELIQHEYDHLDGILATMRAVDNKAFVAK